MAGSDVPEDLLPPQHDVPALDARSDDAVRRFAEQSVASVKELVFPAVGA
jgi:hypothetical protein